MRFSDFKAIRNTYSRYVLEVIKHIHQKFRNPVYR